MDIKFTMIHWVKLEQDPSRKVSNIRVLRVVRVESVERQALPFLATGGAWLTVWNRKRVPFTRICMWLKVHLWIEPLMTPTRGRDLGVFWKVTYGFLADLWPVASAVMASSAVGELSRALPPISASKDEKYFSLSRPVGEKNESSFACDKLLWRWLIS